MTHMEQYHAGLLSWQETMAVLKVRHLVRGSRRHPDAPPLSPEEAGQPIIDPLEIERFCQLGVITREQAEELLTVKRGDTSRGPALPHQYQLF